MNVRLPRGWYFAGVLAVLAVMVGNGAAHAASFSLSNSTLGIAAVPGMNHLPVNLPITPSPASFDLTTLSCSSDAAWVVPKIDATAKTLRLAFATSALITRTNTATITVTDGIAPVSLYVTATVAPLKIVALKADPTRSRVYGLSHDGVSAGSVVIYDPLNGAYVGNITVGLKPTDLDVRSDGSELLIMCNVDRKVYAVDLQQTTVREAIALPDYTDSGYDAVQNTGHVAYGPANTFYYVDGNWAPTLRVFNRSTRTVVQTLTETSNNSFGFGDIAVARDQSRLYSWGQYGWGAGNTSSFAVRFAIGGDGTLTRQEQTVSSWPTGIVRDPLDTPALVSDDGKVVVIKQYVFPPTSLAQPLYVASSPIYAMSPGGEILNTAGAIYQLSTGNKLLDLPVTSTVQAVTFDYSRLVYYNTVSRALGTVNLTEAIGEAVLGLGRNPAEAAIVLSPTKLQWSPIPGVNRYRVYLGTSRSAVGSATTAASSYLGEATSTSINLATTLTAGTTYYWRVDAVTANDVVVGSVFSFTVSGIASDVSAIDAATVEAHRNYAVSIALSSAAPGSTWSASSTDPWISVSAASGVTPASLVVSLDASKLKLGVNTGTVSITSASGSFSIPVKLRVDPLNLTVIKSRPNSTKAYAISENTTDPAARAYLLEIDALRKAVTRVRPVGSSATDLAIHPGDNRIYVTNWLGGAVLAVNMDTMALERTFGFPRGQTNYGEGDAYRISPGTAGRLVVEAEDQWIDVSIYDTANGKVLATSNQREGGGGTDPTGRYYYHGDSNSTGSTLHKLDLVGDAFYELAEVAVNGVGYYGSRTVVVSEDGSRIYWNGAVLDNSLKVKWLIGDEIFSTSTEGRFAFSKTRIYDVESRELLGDMPVSTTVSAYNSATGRLIVQDAHAIGFYNLVGLGLFGLQMSPTNGAIVLAPSQLQWTALPGVSAYQIYFGTSLSAVTNATSSSVEYQGEAASTHWSPAGGLLSGTTYYWRVDPMTTDGPVKGEVASFTVANIAPSLSAVIASTVQADPGYQVSIDLSSASPGLAWTASAAKPWVRSVNGSGTTPGTLTLLLDATALEPGTHETTVTVNANGGGFTMPVNLLVDPLKLTVIRSDPGSSLLYAISEASGENGALGRAYLLRVDADRQAITKVATAGASVTDLAIHNPDKRVYVTNWKLGALLAFDRDTLALTRTYPFQPFSSTGYGDGDVYRISPGAKGRLVLEEQDQWVDVSLFDTAAGTVVAKIGQRQGGGGTDPTGRYYYHGDDNISNASLRKFDLTADVFTAGAAMRPNSMVSYYGSRTVVVAEDGKRIFWNGVVFTSDLATEWTVGDVIYSASGDGRFAFGTAKIYDVSQKSAFLGMPVKTAVSGFSTQAGKLVVQKGGQIGFYAVSPTMSLPAPALTAVAEDFSHVALTWTIDSLQLGFTLQVRRQGESAWANIGDALGTDDRAYRAASLRPGTTYEFRIKADGGGISSPWSATAIATTPALPTLAANTAAADGVGIGSTLTLTAGGTGSGKATSWMRNGLGLGSTANGALTIAGFQPAHAGLYTTSITVGSAEGESDPLIVGAVTAAKVTGNGTEIGADIVHPNKNVYDQILLEGSAAGITADPDQVTRLSYVDLNDDIVQIEFSGPGTLSLVLTSATGPALPAKYNQSVSYMRGHAGIVITGADEHTNVSAFTVGKNTAVNAALFKDGMAYDGVADIAFIAIASKNGKFGGVRTADARYYATSGFTGVYAPGVEFLGPLYLGEVTAYQTATPILRVGSAADVQITGGSLSQLYPANGRPVQVSGITRLKFSGGTDANGHALPAQQNRAVLEEDGRDVTSQIVVNPTP